MDRTKLLHSVKTKTVSDAKEVVLSLVTALNEENFEAARGYADDNMSFVGVLGSREGAEAYFSDMKRMRLKYTIQKVLADDSDVGLFYDLKISGQTIFGCGWYHVENGKVTSLKVIFDPRPLLEASKN
jgi:hypothetical protein